jgi:hypothetical protein
MTSHELSRLLLARRDNDLTFLVHLDDGGTETYQQTTVRLLADDETIDPDLRADGAREPLYYDSLSDQLIVRLGEIYTGEIDDA